MMDDRPPKIVVDHDIMDDDEMIHYVVEVAVPSIWYEKLIDRNLDLPAAAWDGIILELGEHLLTAIRQMEGDNNG